MSILLLTGCTQPTTPPEQLTPSPNETAFQKREQRFLSTRPYANWTPHLENIPVEVVENYTISREYT
jgi:hypothetical protein